MGILKDASIEMATSDIAPQPAATEQGGVGTQRVVNDFSIQVATVNGSGSQSANNVLLRSIFRMGIPVSGKNLFPSNIAGLPTWYTIRASKYGYIARKKEIDFLVAMNPETAQEDVKSLGAGAAVVYDEPLKLDAVRNDLTFYPVPYDKIVAAVCPDAKLRKLVKNMIYVGVVGQILSIDPARIALTPMFQHRDARIEHIALALESQFDTTSRPDRLVAESLGKALAYQLIGSRFQPRGVPAGQSLSPGQRRRLVEFIEGHLEQDLSLAELAQVAGISVSHLKALFRRSFGMPVHQYVIHRRVDRAKALIVSRELPLSEIALRTGFAHQSHMAHMMRRHLGVTPAALSRAGS